VMITKSILLEKMPLKQVARKILQTNLVNVD
jgi:hypothetical protein